MRRLLACAALGIAVLAPAASANDYVGCVTDHNRLGFPYGGNDVNPVPTAKCIVDRATV